METANDRLAALKKRIELLSHIDWEGDVGYSHDDTVFVAQVKSVLLERDLTLDELADMRKPYKDKDDAASKARMDRIMKQHTAGVHNTLFAVANKAQMRIDVIAMDVETAQKFAVNAGHVRSADNASVFRYNEKHVQKLMTDGSALGRAVREGIPGVVEKRGNNVIVGDRVFTPMTVV